MKKLPNWVNIDKYNTLTEREQLYLDIMLSGNSLYLRGNPGTAKSAIGLAISRKLGIRYVDKRLSQIEETDIGLFPVLKDAFDTLFKIERLKKLNILDEKDYQILKNSALDNIKKSQIDSLHYAVPEWAIEANQYPIIIHFEELNRANPHVRNASLQILNERQIGNLQFNENVLIMSSGNFGEEDGTEVDEMDLALSNRLCILDHELPYNEWIEEYAKYYVLPLIVDYIRTKPGEYYKFPPNDEIRYSTPRSWTNLSDFLIFRYGKDPDIKNDIIPALLKVGKGFIGKSVTDIIRYCQNITEVNIVDVMTKWEEVKDDVATFNRARLSELISNLKHVNLVGLEDFKIENIIKFLDFIWKNNGDEVTSYLISLLDKTTDKNLESNSKILKHFKEQAKSLRIYTEQNLKK